MQLHPSLQHHRQFRVQAGSPLQTAVAAFRLDGAAPKEREDATVSHANSGRSVSIF
jgi:hypothetical protein